MRPPLYFDRRGPTLVQQMRALFPAERTAKVRWSTADRSKVAIRRPKVFAWWRKSA